MKNSVVNDLIKLLRDPLEMWENTGTINWLRHGSSRITVYPEGTLNPALKFSFLQSWCIRRAIKVAQRNMLNRAISDSIKRIQNRVKS